ncbi:MAG: 3-dehydroquinate synthase [Chlamydiia bacterium]|nr:3-dehydroquinate synthase [Chlamydiia bacterium]
MRKTLDLHTTIKTHTKIEIEPDFFANESFYHKIKDLGKTIVIITHTKLKKHFGHYLEKRLTAHGIETKLLDFPSGEKAKSEETVAKLQHKMLGMHLGKDTAILALGGGIVSDVAGYVASTYNRGIPLILFPTSLLAMVDAAIGGKTGVNTKYGKNLIGSIYMPEMIFLDLRMLNFLPDVEWTNGLAEVMKYAVSLDSHVFEILESGLDKWALKDPAFVQELISQSCQLKISVVEKDTLEGGYRRVLNFGHTIAHAIEVCEEYELAHGHAVIIGVLVEAYISMKVANFKEETFDKIVTLTKAYNFPLKLSKKTTKKKMMHAMQYDKKSKDCTPRFVLLKSLGEVHSFDGEYCTEVKSSIIEEALDWMFTLLKEV